MSIATPLSTHTSIYGNNVGDLVGFDFNGKLTKVFADSVVFGIKSKQSDKWGTELSQSKDYAERLPQPFSFCGQVIINFQNTLPGDLIISCANDAGAVTPKAVHPADMTDELGFYAVGRVIDIGADGMVAYMKFDNIMNVPGHLINC